MRKLIYVPIIHMEPDMGKVAPDMESMSASLCGEEKWAKHKETVAKFWENLAHYFDTLDTANLKIYQDGLFADGELGGRIIEEGARRGSTNYQLILKLMERGAEIRKTEDPSLLKEEYDYITKLTQPKSAAEKATAYAEYKLLKGQLMRKRDKFIARVINNTLQEGEIGVLLIGSYHNMLSSFSRDIVVSQVKEREKVNAYFEELISGRDNQRFERLSGYLVCPSVAENCRNALD